MFKRQKRATRLQQYLLLGCVSAVLLGWEWPAAADSEGMKLAVSATVLKHASLKLVSQPSSFVIAAADVARGYVDVPGPTQLAIRSNSPGGYMLLFESHSELVRTTRVRGLGRDVQLGANGGVVLQSAPGRGMSNTTVDLVYRFVLVESPQQGTYAWPIQVSVAPL